MKPENQASFGREAGMVALARLTVLGAQFFSSLLIARLVGPAGRGLISSLLVPVQLSIGLSELGIRQSAAFHIGKRILPVERVLPTLLAMIPIASLVAAAFAWAYYEAVGVADDAWGYRLLAVAGVPLSLTVSYATGVFLGRRRISAFRRTSWRPALVNVALIAILGYGLELGVSGVLLAAVGGSASAAAYALYLLRAEGPLVPRLDVSVARRLARKGLGYAAALFLLGLNYKIMILMLTYLGELDDVGLYAQATVIAELLWEIPTVLSSLLLSRAVNARDELGFSRKTVVLARMSFIAAAVIGLVLGAVAPWFFATLYGPAFRDSGLICAILLPGVATFIFFKIIHTDLSGRGKPWAAMLVIVPSLISNVVLGWFLIRAYGAAGAAVASSAAYVLATLGYVAIYARITSLSFAQVVVPGRADWRLVREALASVTRRG